MDAVSCALLPAPCTLCGSPLPLLSAVPICSSCWAEIPSHTQPLCSRCEDCLDPADFESGTCRPCRLAPPPFVRAVSSGPYEGRMRDAIHALKYQALFPAARPLGRRLATAIARLTADLPAGALIVPVPLHRSKFAQRGFNQARLLAGHALSVLRKTHPAWRLSLASGAVIRRKATGSQAGLTPRQRRHNVRAAFVVPDPRAVQGRNVLVVDDILTTGATVRSLARALIRAGAADVWVATLSRAQLGFDHIRYPGRVYSEQGRFEPLRPPAEHRAIGGEMEDKQPSF